MLTRLRFTAILAIAPLLILSSLPSIAGEAAVGRAAPILDLPDQHEKKEASDKKAHVIILAFDMSVAKSFNKWLDARGKDWLPKRNAIYVADISGMPSTIAKLFALPKMRKYKHRILLNREENFAAKFPVEKEMATVIRVNKSGRITSISHVASAEGLRKLLED